MTCDQLAPFYDGELSTEDAETFRHHLAGCPACEAVLWDYLQLDAAAAYLSKLPAQTSWWRRFWAWLRCAST